MKLELWQVEVDLDKFVALPLHCRSIWFHGTATHIGACFQGKSKAFQSVKAWQSLWHKLDAKTMFLAHEANGKEILCKSKNAMSTMDLGHGK